jgi:hypothetical protein
MEMVLDVYSRDYDELHPVVCLDEMPGQLHEETRAPMENCSDAVRRQDFEYKRQGTYTACVMVEPLGGWRHVDLRVHKKDEDFADHLIYLAREAYPDASKITVVLDNLSTHRKEVLWKVLPAKEALEVARRLELVHTPKHGSWLNMAELELSVLSRQCMGLRRFGEIEKLADEVHAWEERRNRLQTKIEWGFTVEKSRQKFQRFYGAVRPDELS